jgi:V8-like Glu-specific endopeptidase
MKFKLPRFEEKLTSALALFDRKAAVELCSQLMDYLNSTNEAVPPKSLETTLQQLRNKRMFTLMQRVADCCIQTGRQTYKIRRQYAQSLIDQEIFTASLTVLHELKNDTANDASKEAAAENKEANGLIGRVYKQLYVNADEPGNPRFATLLKLALQHYQSVYSLSPETSLWHGINIAALLKRAEKDKVAVSGFPDAAKLAKEILTFIEAKDATKNADTWDFATAMEASVALNLPKEALAWMSRYIQAPYTDAFELGSTIRQLKEVWKLDENKGIGKAILPLLNAALLKREGTNILLDTVRFKKQQKEDAIYAQNLEKVFGDESFKTFDWYMKGKDRCMPVARIGKERSKGFGTGFLLPGKFLHPDIKDQLVLITNAHVVSNTPAENNNSLLPEEAVVILETIDSKAELQIEKIFWTSPAGKLDISVLLFDEESHKKVKKLTESIIFYPVAKTLPAADGKQRVYIIGHPAGGTLQISLQDNVLLAHKDPKLHYRTPTVGGSSGSPVFNDKWELVAVHHAAVTLKKATASSAAQEANEGIWIQRIIQEMNK